MPRSTSHSYTAWSAEGFAERITENIQFADKSNSAPVGPFQIMMRLAIGVDTVLIQMANRSTSSKSQQDTDSLISLMSALPGRIFLYNGEELVAPSRGTG